MAESSAILSRPHPKSARAVLSRNSSCVWLCVRRLVERASADEPTASGHSVPSHQVADARRHQTDQAVAESRAPALLSEGNSLVDIGKFNEAVAVLGQTIAVLESLVGKDDWRTKTARASLTEAVRLSKFSSVDQNRYVAARQKRRDGARERKQGKYDSAEASFLGAINVMHKSCLARIPSTQFTRWRASARSVWQEATRRGQKSARYALWLSGTHYSEATILGTRMRYFCLANHDLTQESSTKRKTPFAMRSTSIEKRTGPCNLEAWSSLGQCRRHS